MSDILARNSGVCIRCELYRATVVHTRCAKKDPTPANQVGLCVVCAEWVSEFDWEQVYEEGWRVPRYRNPEEVPLITLTGRTVMLLDDGNYVMDDPFVDYWPEEVA